MCHTNRICNLNHISISLPCSTSLCSASGASQTPWEYQHRYTVCTLKSGMRTPQVVIPVNMLINTGICSCYTGQVLSAYSRTCPIFKTRVLALQNISGFGRRAKTTFQVAGYMFLVDTTRGYSALPSETIIQGNVKYQ